VAGKGFLDIIQQESQLKLATIVVVGKSFKTLVNHEMYHSKLRRNIRLVGRHQSAATNDAVQVLQFRAIYTASHDRVQASRRATFLATA
jgi:ABC-type uncharacterized transport system permease subunit